MKGMRKQSNGVVKKSKRLAQMNGGLLKSNGVAARKIVVIKADV